MPQQPRRTDPRPPRSASRRKRERRREAELRRATAPPPSRRWWIAGGAGAAVVVVVVLVVLLTRGHTTPSTRKPTPAPTPVPAALAALPSSGGTAAVGGITCDAPSSSSPTSSTSSTTTTASTTATAHLAINVNGEARLVPAGIGVGTPQTSTPTDDGPLVSGPCYYWINTRTQDGLIHVRAPQPGTYTLGQLFDLWGQPLSATQAGPASGAVTVLVNGSQYSGDPRAVPLTQHAVIQLDVGTATPFKSYSFPAGQ